MFEQLVPGTYTVAFDLGSMVLVDGGYVVTDQNVGVDSTDSDSTLSRASPPQPS